MINNIIGSTTGSYQNEIERLRSAFEKADAVIIGSGSGLSASAGYDFGGERLKRHFSDFVEKYGMTDMYTGCFADFESKKSAGHTGHAGHGSTAMSPSQKKPTKNCWNFYPLKTILY